RPRGFRADPDRGPHREAPVDRRGRRVALWSRLVGAFALIPPAGLGYQPVAPAQAPPARQHIVVRVGGGRSLSISCHSWRSRSPIVPPVVEPIVRSASCS